MNRYRSCILTLMLFTACICVQAQPIENLPLVNLPLVNRQSILNDKAFFLFPAGAANSARSTDIMSADPNANEETRIVWDRDSLRLVFYAQDLFALGGNNLFSFVSGEDSNGFKSKVLAEKDSLTAILSTPLTFDSTKDAILVNSLMVKTQDHSLFRIGAYINPKAYKNKNEFQALSERVFETLSKGSRRLYVKARKEAFPVLGGSKKFNVDLPEGFLVTRDEMHDFEVLRFRRVNDITDTNWLSLTIYAGFHPSYFYKEYGFDEKEPEKTKGSFLNKNVEWLYFKNREKQFYLKEQIIPGNTIQKGLVLHIAMLGNSGKAIDELTNIVGKIRLTDK